MEGRRLVDGWNFHGQFEVDSDQYHTAISIALKVGYSSRITTLDNLSNRVGRRKILMGLLEKCKSGIIQIKSYHRTKFADYLKFPPNPAPTHKCYPT